jgi:Flp pilus assembly protein TadG
METATHCSHPAYTARQHGGVVVEFALLLPLMLTLLAGIFEIGRTFWYYDALSNATRNAARAISVSNKATIATVAIPAAKTLLADAAASAGIPNFTSSNVTVACLDAALNDTACADGSAPGGVRVTINSYQVAVGSYIPFIIGNSALYTVNLAPSTTMPYML